MANAFPTPRLAPPPLATLVRETRSTQHRGRWPQAPAGDGRPAMLVPGFLAGDQSLARMARWLREAGWETVRPGIRANVGCMEPGVAAIERRLEDAVARTGRRALVIGQSRGGTFGWALAVRRPDLVETLITLGSPVLDQLAISRPTRAMTVAVGALGTLGVPGMFTTGCRSGACCERSRGELAGRPPAGVRTVAIYSREDAIVSWQACLAPGAEHVEVRGTHSGMGVSSEVWRRVAQALAA